MCHLRAFFYKAKFSDIYKQKQAMTIQDLYMYYKYIVCVMM